VDIYALGVLGYELLTGRAPFAATTAQEMLAAHVTAVPEPVERYRPMVSSALAAVVMKCLAKKPADRWQTAEELLTHLEPLATPSGGTTPTQTAPTGAVARAPRWVRWAAGVAALAAVALVAGLLLRPRPLTITVSDATPVTSEPGIEYQPAIFPDGKEVAFVAGRSRSSRLVMRSTANVAGGGEARPADSSLLREGFPSWSPDGDFVRFVACRAAGCTWNEVGKLGGAVRPVPLPRRTRANGRLVWSPDGTRFAFPAADTIFAAMATDTTPRLVAVHRAAYSWLHSLAWSPDGRSIAYVNGNGLWQTTGNLANSSIWVVSARGGEPRPITTEDDLNVSPAWLDARHLLFVSDRDGPRGLYVVEVGSRGSRGNPRAIPGVPDPHAISVAPGAGRLAFAKFTYRQNIRAYPLDRPLPVSIRDGRPVTSGSQVVEMSDPSPDGRWLAFDSNVRGRKDIYRIALAGGNAVALTSLPGNEESPRWSPDGREIAFHSSQDAVGSSRIMVMPAEGGPPVAVTSGPGTDFWPAWSPNGLAIAYESKRAGSVRIRIVSRDSVGGTWRESGELPACEINDLNWAPDGSGVLCDTNARVILYSLQGRELWHRDLKAPGQLTGYSCTRMSPDGRTIFTSGWHRDGRAGVWAIPVPSGPIRLVVAEDDPALEAICMSVGRDRLFVTVGEYESDIWVAKLRW
jgi:Tol biopolymer transport system component